MNTPPNTKTDHAWRLKKGMDRRFLSGHPWVYSNELQVSPKGVEKGQRVDLFNAGGEFIASGFANPNSLIAFRACDRTRKTADIETQVWVSEKIKAAEKFRLYQGMQKASHRLFFAEADGIPGLVIDCYVLANNQGKVHVIQTQTAGADKLLPFVLEVFKGSTCVVKNSSEMRKLEGLEVEETRVVGPMKASELKKVAALVQAGYQTLTLFCDLIDGQKTGLFLDQRTNIEFAMNRALMMKFTSKNAKILDLCSYVGQWSAFLAKTLLDRGVMPEITLVDASEKALGFAKLNVQATGAELVRTEKLDVLQELDKLPMNAYDIVICDPPALISSRKHLPVGKSAYSKLNTQAFKRVADNGLFVSCSCSGLLGEDDFVELLAKSAHRAEKSPKVLGRGMQSYDHPALFNFPEGRYLKAWFAQC